MKRFALLAVTAALTIGAVAPAAHAAGSSTGSSICGKVLLIPLC
jgi:hypothetical protein